MTSKNFSTAFFSTLNQRLTQNYSADVTGLIPGSRSLFYLLLTLNLRRPVVVVVEDEDNADRIADDINAYLNLTKIFQENVGINTIPPLLNLPDEVTVPEVYTFPTESKEARLRCLSFLTEQQTDHRKNSILLIPYANWRQKIIAPLTFTRLLFNLNRGQEISYKTLTTQLTEAGYYRVDYVEQPGEFAVRGEVFDLWSPNNATPVRMTFLGTEIETIYTFDRESQRSQEMLTQVQIIPTREIEETTIRTFLPDTAILVNDRNVIHPTNTEQLNLSSPGDERDFSLTTTGLDLVNIIGLSTGPDSLDFGTTEVTPVHHHFDLLITELTRWDKEGYNVYITVGTENERDRILELVEDKISVLKSPVSPEVIRTKPVTRLPPLPPVYLTKLSTGFMHPVTKLVILATADITGQKKVKFRSPRFRVGRVLESLQEINPGDFVVHEKYGIGIYRGIEHIVIDRQATDFLCIEYKNTDKLHVPITDFRLVQKYAGPEGYRPRVHSLDTVTWERVKQRVKESVLNLSRELLHTEAVRTVQKGYSFSLDSVIEKEFALTFPYEETPDQEQAICEVTEDMESDKPMDRLIVGDVGFGKTEVALRAALKCTVAGKQIGMLVPTTILAEQHYETFSARLKDFPVTVKMLSRFVTQKEQKQIITGLTQGTVDIVIGTHRLLSKDIQFRDLGLLIIDEEHRFGVRAKEKIKYLRSTVDVLTLTATPIPRTLAMTLGGLRKVSQISTPPEGRLPVHTYVGPYDAKLVRQAIQQELDRNGQVFYVHNRIATIDTVVNELHTMFPLLKIGTAHGGMPAVQLENTIHRFLHREFTILVCTSIIEAGLDMPQVNTLIVEKAEDFGLAQLYQLRGRVGRAEEKAYCYFFYSAHGIENDMAVKRLRAIQEFASLGSGIRLALRDLEIRGMGNLLGQQQHGFISELGYDLYLRILTEEVRKVSGKETKKEIVPVLDIPWEAYIPENYIPTPEVRIIFYKRLLSVHDEYSLIELKQELTDRFGRLPEVVINLFYLGELRVYAQKIGISRIERLPKCWNLCFDAETKVNPEKLVNFVSENKEMLSLCEQQGIVLIIKSYLMEKTEFITFIKSLSEKII